MERQESADYEYATNFDRSAAYEIDRTHHKIRRRDGRHVVSACGQKFIADEDGLHADDEGLEDDKKCQRGPCFGDGPR